MFSLQAREGWLVDDMAGRVCVSHLRNWTSIGLNVVGFLLYQSSVGGCDGLKYRVCATESSGRVLHPVLYREGWSWYVFQTSLNVKILQVNLHQSKYNVVVDFL